MEHYEIVYRLSSDAGFTGTVEVHELANAMVAFADTVQSALDEYGAGGKLSVDAKPFRQGSFIMDFVLTYGNPLMDLFTSREADALANVLGILGFAGTSAAALGATLPKVVRKVHGKVNEHRKTEKGTYIYGDGDDAIEVDERTHRVIQSPTVARKYKATALSPIETIDISINVQIQERADYESGRTDTGEVFTSGDVGDLEMYEHVAVEGVPEETEDVVSETKDMVLSPVNGSYRGSDRGYTFKSGEQTLRGVKIHDLGFLQKLESGEVRLMGEDVLIVDVECIQSLAKSGKLTKHYTITKVKRYIRYEPPHQSTIDDVLGE